MIDTDTVQLDLFARPALKQMRAKITSDNVLVLLQPSMDPRGIEAVERRAARLREIEDRKRTIGRITL